MLILGLTFAGSGWPRQQTPAASMCCWPPTSCPTADRNDSAAYLAQRTQLGSGNTSAPVVAHHQAAAAAPPAQAGDAQGTGLSSGRGGRRRAPMTRC